MRKRHVIPALLVAAIAVAAWLAVLRPTGSGQARSADVPKASGPAVPVAAAEVRRADVPVFLTGLGTVRAFNSVLVRSRVEGQIVRVDFAEGQEVHAGDVLAEIDPQPFEVALAQAQAARLKDQAQIDNARRELDRATRLVATGAGTAQQLDAAKAMVAQLEAAAQADQAAIDSAQLQLGWTRIRSPLGGRAGARLVDAGNLVRAGDAGGIVTVNQVRPIFVDFALPADTLARVRARMASGDIAVTARDRQGKDLAAGRLVMVDNQVDTATATVRYKAMFDNADEALWPGLFVDVRLLLETRRDAIVVPTTAVLRGPDGTYAFVLDVGHVASKRPVTVASSDGEIAVVEAGLEPGEQVVTDGQYRIQAGTSVEVRPQGAAPAS